MPSLFFNHPPLTNYRTDNSLNHIYQIKNDQTRANHFLIYTGTTWMVRLLYQIWSSL